MRPNDMIVVDCSIIKPNLNELQSDRHHPQKTVTLLYIRSTLSCQLQSRWWSKELQNITELPAAPVLRRCKVSSHDSPWDGLRHGMDIVRCAVNVLNPGQVPIITAEQHLYTLCKQIQWTWPDLYEEDHFVVILGPNQKKQFSSSTIFLVVHLYGRSL